MLAVAGSVPVSQMGVGAMAIGRFDQNGLLPGMNFQIAFGKPLPKLSEEISL